MNRTASLICITMGMCSSLRPRLLGDHALSCTSESGSGGNEDGCNTDTDSSKLRTQQKADKKRSRIIDDMLKAEKRAYKQIHRLLLLGELTLTCAV